MVEPAGHAFPARFAVVGGARRGGGADVYRAIDRETSGPVALKVVRDAGPVTAARLEREAALLAALSHPSLPRYVWHGSDALGRPCLALEWIEGPSLAERLIEAPLVWRDAVRVARGTAAALAYLHARSVVHRDVKPGNLLLAAGSLDAVHLVDLGIARDEDRTADWTRAGEPIGTPGFMAPEQARGRLDVDARADVFGLGAVVFRCITGRAPFVGESVTATLAKLLFDRAPRLSELVHGMPAWLDDLVDAMLRSDRAERPSDAAAVLAAFDRATTPAELAPASLPLSQPRALTQGEQRVFGVLVAALGSVEPEVGDITRSLATAAPRDPWLVERALSVCAGHGARAEIVANGTLVAALDRGGDADERAEAAAALAIALGQALGGLPSALATGMGQVGDGVLIGEAIERASRLLVTRQRWLSDASAPVPPSADALLVDETTAALLAARMRVEPAAEGRWLVPVAPRARALTPLVGRQRELQLLEAELAACRDRPRSGAVVLLGPAGIGKSRLASELVARLGPEAQIWRGSAAGLTSGSLALVKDLLEHALADQPLPERATSLDADRISTFLSELVGAGSEGPVSIQVRAARQDPMLMADQMRRAFVDLLRARVAARPLVLVLDDLHRADAASLGFVGAALRALRARPLFVIGLARPEARERARELFEWRGLVTRELAELDPADAQRLALGLLGDSKDPELAAQIAEGASGNPFFLEELAREARERPAGEPRLHAPESVLSVLRASLERLPAAARRALRAASVYGGSFSRPAIGALLDASESAAELGMGIETLLDELLIEPRARPFDDGSPALAFRHDLVREAADGMLTDADRELGHRLAARYLAALPRPNASAVAEHFVRGRDARRASEWAVRAGEHALAVGDLDAAETLGDRAERLGAEGELLGRAHLLRAESGRWKGDARAAREHGVAALELLAPDSEAWCRAAGEVATASGKLGEHDELERLGARLVAELPGAALGPRVVAASRAATQLFYAGRRDAAKRLLDALDALAPEELWAEPLARARLLGTRSVDALFERRPDRQLAHVRAARDAFLAAGDLRDACLYELTIAHASMALGRAAEAAQVLREARTTAEQLGAPYLATLAALNLGLALAQADAAAAAEGAELLSAVVRETEASGDVRQHCAARTYRALAWLAAGRPAEAEVEARRAVELAESAATLRANAVAVLAETLLALERVDDVLALLATTDDALESAEEGGARLRLAHASALERSGRPAEARERVAKACQILREQAERIDDPELRRSFLEDVAEHRRSFELAARLEEALR